MQDKTVANNCKPLGVTEQTCYRWRKEYGGMKVDHARWLKELEAENTRLTRAVENLAAEQESRSSFISQPQSDWTS